MGYLFLLFYRALCRFICKHRFVAVWVNEQLAVDAYWSGGGRPFLFFADKVSVCPRC